MLLATVMWLCSSIGVLYFFVNVIMSVRICICFSCAERVKNPSTFPVHFLVAEWWSDVEIKKYASHLSKNS